jgi:capsular polysaccharide biosynthesis protein
MSEAAAGQSVSEIPISKAADKVEHFEKAALLSGSVAVSLGDAMLRMTSGRAFQPVRSTTTVRNYWLTDVVFDGTTLLLFKDESIIPETSYFVPPSHYAVVRVQPERLNRLEDDELHVVAYNRAYHSYYHWLTQCIPAIDWALRTASGRRVRLMLPSLAPWQEETLALLGYADVPRHVVALDQQYLLSSAVYSEFLNGRTSFGICLSALATCRRMLSDTPPKTRSVVVIYVRADEFYYGKLTNSDEVTEFLERRGVRIVDGQGLTVKDRIELFRTADVVIGPHHDGLANVLFCQAGALLWELMPDRLHNPCYNRLAQAAELDYWADQFESLPTGATCAWRVDMDVLAERWWAISTRLATIKERTASHPSLALKPLDDLMMEFENLGDNCEFGLIQRSVGAEPLGLFRFAGIRLPIRQRLGKLVAALDSEFEGLGTPGSIAVELQGLTGKREFLAHESVYKLMYHTFITEGAVDAETLAGRESRRLRFLRRKLIDDLRVGEKIWVWKSRSTETLDDIMPLLAALRRYGPNRLLWVVEGDGAHEPGTAELLQDDLVVGYVERFAPEGNATDISPLSWLQVCQAAYNLYYPTSAAQEEPELESAPSVQPMTALQILTCDPAPLSAAAPPAPSRSFYRRLFHWSAYCVSRR